MRHILLLRRLQFVSLISVVTCLMLMRMPVADQVSTLYWDKLAHAVGWCGLYLSLRFAIRGSRYLWISAVLLFGYSVLLEFIQALVPTRHFEGYDILANGIGVLTGIIVIVCIVIARDRLSSGNGDARKQ